MIYEASVYVLNYLPSEPAIFGGSQNVFNISCCATCFLCSEMFFLLYVSVISICILVAKYITSIRPSQGWGAGETGHSFFAELWSTSNYFFREQRSKLLILGSWQALSECYFLTCFGFCGGGRGSFARKVPFIHINIAVKSS